ncbi:MAG: PIG-L family deacetylase [Candidatus Aenigmarchaeota archaeon]|nr:PIG-L family deacetylase [Candidatus Aenigmarchaeota archaeon]
MEKILVVAAHPDDETIGAGGTIINHINKGDEVHILILGEGVTSRYEKRELANPGELVKLKNDFKDCMKILNVKNFYFCDMPDNRFDQIDMLDVTKIVEKYIEKIRPAVIYTHHFGDLNIDHRITHDAVVVAARPVRFDVKKILCFETVSSTDFASYTRQNIFVPNYFVDITKTLNKKLLALEKFRGEIKEPPHPRSIKNIKMLAHLRGSFINRKYAEAFSVVRVVE